MGRSAIGDLIELRQAEIGLSTKDLAEKLGVTASRVCEIKTQDRLRPQTIHKLSRALNTPVRRFFNLQVKLANNALTSGQM